MSSSACTASVMMPDALPAIQVRTLGQVDYRATWQAMIDFTAARASQTPDELWLCEHPPVYTLGRAGKAEHLLRDNGIELIRVDRGGQITYHGPGQVVIYLLVDLDRRRLGIRDFVFRIEQAIIDLLGEHGVSARRRDGAPGVYVDEVGKAGNLAKIASLGLRIRRGCSYHGLSLNVDMDLTPFSAINPCGYAGLAVTQARDLNIALPPAQVAERLAGLLIKQLESS